MRIEDLPVFWELMPLNIHPWDKKFLTKYNNACFNLHYPPPAFIGDIINAKVIILLLNGGYDSVATPAEFPDPEAEAAYRERLARPRPIEDNYTAPYYLGRNYTPWLRDGRAAVLNAVAYRSKDTKDPCVSRLSKSLPSAEFHRKWLKEALWPEVREGRRFVVVHRWGLWNGADTIFRESENAIYAKHPHYRSENLSTDEYNAASNFFSETGALRVER